MNVSSFDLNHARALHHLIEEAHVARAAKRLGITPAAASNALRKLRGEFDDELLVRQGRTLTRTPLAEALRLPARELLLSAEHLVTASARFDAATYEGAFDLALSDHAATVLLEALHGLFAASAPRATLRVRAVPAELVTELRSSVHVAVTPLPKPDAALVTEPLCEDRLVCLLRRRHPLSRGPWSAKRFAAADHVAVTAQTTSEVDATDAALEARGLSRRTTRAVPTFALLPALLAHSDLIATVPESVARAYPKSLGMTHRTLPITLPAVVTKLAWHVRHAADLRHLWLRQLVRDAAARSGLRSKRGALSAGWRAATAPAAHRRARPASDPR
jgi:DNA-binding transcriptional LysR family regulator